jgi:transaldolase/glucose-6-phosphate isomerase
MTNSLRALGDAGQAVWLDYLHPKIFEDGELARLIADDGVTGLTSNPAIFEKAIGEGDTYDARISALLKAGDHEMIDLFEGLAIVDIQHAADAFRPVYDRLGGKDGYVSLEVSPYLAMDADASVAEARRLWRAVDRPNLMIKVPGTAPCVPAIRTLIGEGINVNVTLLFGIDAYLKVAEAYTAGLEDLRKAKGDISRVHSVASFFVSRIDGMIDKEIDRRLASGAADAGLKALRGKVAIANAKLAYQRYLEMIATPRWKALADAGASPQRLLWASTGTKDPAYSDVLYVESLIGPDTVDTAPLPTIDAFRDHGHAHVTITEGVDEARHVLAETERLGLDLDGVTTALVKDGVEKFAEAFDKLLGAVAGKRTQMLGAALNGQAISLPADLDKTVKADLETAAKEGWTRRMWTKDASLWTGGDAAHWLGWLDAAKAGAVDLEALAALGAEVEAGGFTHALLLGMGGSSLGPEVLSETFGARPGFPKLFALDSTDPAQIARVEALTDPTRTLYIVASKSGSTLEPDILHRYFFQQVERALGPGNAGKRFIAITDPGSKLETLARRDGFLHVFLGDPAIGGRYSVLSNFGMVPAAVIGLDVGAIFKTIETMVRACGPSAPAAANPGFVLGATIGAAAKAGRDKLTLVASDAIAGIGAWLEQLLAESTGKHGLGVVPLAGEPIGPPDVYGADRLFAYLRLDGAEASATDAAVDALEAAGQPVVRITLADTHHLFQEFLRWEVATAVAGVVIGIDPFDQPDVEASKIKTRALTDAYEKSGTLETPPALVTGDGLTLYTDAVNAGALTAAAAAPTLEAWLKAHFARVGPGDYVGLLAYIDRNDDHTTTLQAIRTQLRDRLKVATVLGFGPRFLHSTGQAYKGGPNSGVFLEITSAHPDDLNIPGRGLTFGVVVTAQGQGDFDVLAERGRRVLRVDLGADVAGGLARLAKAVDSATA